MSGRYSVEFRDFFLGNRTFSYPVVQYVSFILLTLRLSVQSYAQRRTVLG